MWQSRKRYQRKSPQSESRLVSGEMVGAQSGLGFLVMDSKNCLRPDALLAVILVIGVIGLLLDTLIRLIEGEIACR